MAKYEAQENLEDNVMPPSLPVLHKFSFVEGTVVSGICKFTTSKLFISSM